MRRASVYSVSEGVERCACTRSDSEYVSSTDEVAPVTELAPQSLKAKKKPSACPVAAAPKPRKRKITIAPVANAKALSESPISREKKSKNLFSIINSDERSSSSKTSSTYGTPSNFTTRVSSGQCRRTTTTSGEFYVDLKIYHTADVKSTPVDERYKKALASLKLQCSEKSREWMLLQNFLGHAHSIFEDCEPTYYSNRITFK